MRSQKVHTKSKQILQFIRYGVVGLSSNIAGYSVFLLLTHLGMPYKLAMTLLYLVGIIVGFLGNKKWVFSHYGGFAKAGYKYLLSHFLGYFLNLSILSFFVDDRGYSYRIVQAIAILVVGIFLFLMCKFFVFKYPLANSYMNRSHTIKNMDMEQKGKS